MPARARVNLPSAWLPSVAAWPAPSARARRFAWGLVAAIAVLVLVRLAAYWALARPFGGLAQAMCRMDCNWYVHAARHGYDRAPFGNAHGDAADWAFFPLYVLLMRGVSAATGLGFAAGGVAVSSLCFGAFLFVSTFYRMRTRPEGSVAGWMLFAACYPFGVYFSAPYTESLYLFLSAGALLALRKGDALGAGAWSALLSATRPTGIVMTPLIAWECARREWRAASPGGRDWRDTLARALPPVALAPLGLFGFMAFLYWRTGDALAFSHVQIAWDRAPGNPLVNLVDGFRAWDWANLRDLGRPQSQSYCAAWAVLGFAAGAWLAWRRRYGEAFLCLAPLLMALGTGLYSMPRYLSGSAVFLFAAFDFLDSGWRRPWRWAVCGVLLVLQMLLVVAWYELAWFLM